MFHQIWRIKSKPEDYKVCKCKTINWHENKKCFFCGESLKDIKLATWHTLDNKYTMVDDSFYLQV